MSSRMHWTKKMVALIFAALFILSPVTSFASAGGITGEANISAVYDPAIMNGSGKVNIATHKAVSYTHLDVYKRQHMPCAAVRGGE